MPNGVNATYGYFAPDEDNQCFSLAKKYFKLPEGKQYSIALTSDPKSWGEECATKSQLFVPKALYLSVTDADGNPNPTIDVTCSDHVAYLGEFNMKLNVPDENAEGGFDQKDIPFDYFVGTEEELFNYFYSFPDEEREYYLKDALAHYR